MRSARGFTLIELLVVMAIIATLLTIATPRYFDSIRKSEEATLRQNLSLTRESIDKYFADSGRYPDALEDLVSKRYLRALPFDPIAGNADSWSIVPPPDADLGRVYDLHSSAEGNGRDGTPYASW
ncbi:MAG TPA: type II secretion system protein [Rhodocyclaceae bacterium]